MNPGEHREARSAGLDGAVGPTGGELVTLESREHVLDNGLRVVLASDHGTPVVAVNLWYAVGSRNEPPGRTGFAHLFEHMMFQGSAHVSKNGHFRQIEGVGGSANATTWFDRTNYFQTVPSHHLDLALWLESDRMGWMLPAMTAEKLENQRQVVLNERMERYENQPYGDWDERVQSLLFPADHPYRHTVIGSPEDIAAATLDDVADFFATYYVPNNAVLSICGDFDPDHALDRVSHYFGAIPAGPPPPSLPGQVRIPFATGPTRAVDVPGAVPLPRVYIAARVPPFATDLYHPGEIAAHGLGTGRTSRLYDRVVRPQAAKSASCHVLPLTSGATMFLAIATGFPGADPADLEAAVAAELDAAADLTEAEVARAVIGTETRIRRALQRVETRADLLSMHATLLGSAERFNDEVRRLRSVTPDDVHAWCADYLHGDNRVVVRYLPEAAS